MRYFKALGILSFCLSLYGCSILHHKDQLLMMAEYSRDKNEQHKIVGDINTNYDALVAAIQSCKLKNYPDKRAIVQNFGQPILKKKVTIAGYPQDQWLYRHAVGHKAKDKVYLYFNPEGKLINYTQENIQWK
jgi:hypothetical protein